ncbi:MAG TPA: hypothetical protein DD435_02305 [Cyanobacteria bacterium UBA8530]|nr:hypothetical protein [Cyanobacteria bacterium UBA8530]
MVIGQERCYFPAIAGSFVALALGSNEITVRSGAAKGSRTVSVAPPAGVTSYPADNVVDIQDFSLTYFYNSGVKYLHYVYKLSIADDLGMAHNNYYYPGLGNDAFSSLKLDEDTFSLLVDGDKCQVAQHFLYNSQIQISLNPLDASNGFAPPAAPAAVAYIHDRERISSLASDGTKYLAVGIEVGAESSFLKTYLYDAALAQVVGGTKVCELGTIAVDSLNYTISSVWNESEYLVAFTRKQQRVVNGEVKSVLDIQAFRPIP